MNDLYFFSGLIAVCKILSLKPAFTVYNDVSE